MLQLQINTVEPKLDFQGKTEQVAFFFFSHRIDFCKLQSYFLQSYIFFFGMIGDVSSPLLGFYHKNFPKFVVSLMITSGEAKGEVAAALPIKQP